MNKLLYVLSKPVNNKPRLIGELTEDDGEYTFRYRLGGTLPEWFLLLDEFPDVTKVYKGEEVRPFINRNIPRPDSKYLDLFLKEAGVTKYDEWALLSYQGKFNPREDAYLYEKIPAEAIVYA
jgi:hypothetical protein